MVSESLTSAKYIQHSRNGSTVWQKLVFFFLLFCCTAKSNLQLKILPDKIWIAFYLIYIKKNKANHYDAGYLETWVILLNKIYIRLLTFLANYRILSNVNSLVLGIFMWLFLSLKVTTRKFRALDYVNCVVLCVKSK